MTRFRVMAQRCATCIYRKDSALDLNRLEDQVRDSHGGFRNHRQCHHSGHKGEPSAACCRGFWDHHKDEFYGGQLAQRFNMIEWVEK
jgi:hypothetical protein